MLAFSAWHLKRKDSVDAFRRTAIIALVVLLPAIMLTLFVGGELEYAGQVPTHEDRRRRGALEHLAVPLLVLALPDRGRQQRHDADPDPQDADLLSILATNHVDGEVQGMNQLQAQYTKQYGPGNYVPNVFIQYWSMRVMAYLGSAVLLFALWGAWLLRKKKLEQGQTVPACRARGGGRAVPDEHGRLAPDRERRQPWIVQGLLKTAQAASRRSPPPTSPSV